MGAYRKCALLLLKHFGVSSTDHLLAAEVLCRELHNLKKQGQIHNTTAVTNTFHGVCCTNITIFETFCRQYLHKLDVPLNCTKRDQNICSVGDGGEDVSGLSEYDTTTYLLMALFIPMGLIGNLLILYAICKLKCLPRQTGYFLSSLAVADLGVIIQFVVFFVYNKAEIDLPESLARYLIPSVDMFAAAVSLLQITMISIERAVAVTWPLKYPSYISVKRAKIIVFILWCFSFLLFLYSISRIFITSQIYVLVNFYTNVTLLLLIPIFIIITSYTFVLVCAYKNLSQDRQRMKMITLLIRTTRSSTLLNEHNNSCNTLDEKEQAATIAEKKRSLKISSLRCREIKLAINVAMIVLPFLGCWGYFVAAHLYEVLTHTLLKGVANLLISVAPFLVSSFNPVLYLIFTRSLRKAVKSMIQRNVKSKLSRTELSVITLTTLNSRRPSSIVSLGVNNRKIGRDFSVFQKDENDLAECLIRLNQYEDNKTL